MRPSLCMVWLGFFALLGAALLFLFPLLDLTVAGWFYDGRNFPWDGAMGPELIHGAIQPLSWGVGYGLLGALLVALLRQNGWLRLDGRAWFFLLVSFIAGPVLMANVVLKDNWDRARPRQIAEFGGTRRFTPPLLIATQCDRNCSFVSGDASFGFWLHSVAYVAPRRRRYLFYGGLAMGALTGLLRIGMGAHFLSDVYFAGFIMMATSAFVYGLTYGRLPLSRRWGEWLGPVPA